MPPVGGITTGKDLKQIRVSLRLSLRQFALIVDVSYSLVGHYEKGRRQLPAETARHIETQLTEYCQQQIQTYQQLLKLYTNC